MDHLEGLCPEVDPKESEEHEEINTLDETNDNVQTKTKETQNLDTFLGEEGSHVEEQEQLTKGNKTVNLKLREKNDRCLNFYLIRGFCRYFKTVNIFYRTNSGRTLL